MDARELGTKLEAQYRNCASQYRQNDEIEVNTDHHCWLWKRLQDLTLGFGREITVLEAGCGTGRYFHCLSNVGKLVAMDLSAEMLEIARQPVRGERVTVREIEFVRANLFQASFPPGSFDMVYSLGVFGCACPLSKEILNRFHEWLAADGVLFFDVTDTRYMAVHDRLRRKLRDGVYGMLPRALQRRIDTRGNGLPMYFYSRRELARLMQETRFVSFELEAREFKSACWDDRKIECIARKKRAEVKSCENGMEAVVAHT